MARSIRSRKVRRHATLLLELLEARELLDGDTPPVVGFDPVTGLPPFPYDEVDRQVMYDDLQNIEDPIAQGRPIDNLFDGINQWDDKTETPDSRSFSEEIVGDSSGVFPIEWLDREFMVFDNIRVAGEPDLVGEFGLQTLQLFTTWYFWAPGEDTSLPDPDRIRSSARFLDPRSILIVDIEHWPTRGPEEVVADSIRKLAEVVDTIKEVNPDVVTGIYSMMPVRDYWTPVNYGYDSPQFEAWAASNARLQELADHVDIIVPSVYTFYPDYNVDGTPRIWERDRWVQYATANLLQARQYGKPVVSYIWPLYHGGGGSTDPNAPDYRYWKYQPIGAEFWNVILETVYQYSDSTAIFEYLGGPWDDESSWWTVTQDFLSEIVPALALGESTTHGIVTSGDWRDTRTNENATVTITVNSVNDAPTARNDRLTIGNLMPATLNVLADNGSGADSDKDGTLIPSTVTLVSSPSQGALMNNLDGTFTYTPFSSFSGSDSFTYRVADDLGALSNTATVTVGWNSPPLAMDDLIDGAENTPQTINVVAGNAYSLADSDVDGNLDPTSTNLISGPAYGTLVRNSDGTFLYTPNSGFVGTDTFRYTVADLFGAVSNVATVTIIIAAVNDPPLARNDVVQTQEDTSKQFNVLLDNGNGPDFDPDGSIAANTTVAISGPSHGLLMNHGDGSFTYFPTSNYSGIDSFTYQVRDNTGALSNLATVTITVTEVNDAPLARNDLVTTPRNTQLTFNVLTNHGSGADVDLDGQIVQVQRVSSSGPTYGTLVAGSGGVGSFVYSPSSGFSGTDSFQYRVVDDDGALSSPATVTIVVNTPPLAQDDTFETVEDVAVLMDILADNGPGGADTDEDGTLQPATIKMVSTPARGTLVFNADWTLVYTPELNFSGSDSFVYTVADNDGAVSNPATVEILVAEVNDAPLVRDDEVTTVVDVPIVINVLIDNGQGPDSDVDGTLVATTTTVAEPPNIGELTNQGDGTFRYVPAPNFVGTVTFTYTVRDNDGASSELATVTIHVQEPNQAPVALDDSAQTEEDTPLTVFVLPDSGTGSDYDPEGKLDPSTTVAVTQPRSGLLTNHRDGTFTYIPDLNFYGTDSFTYQVSDQEGVPSNIARVTIQVTEVNDLPVAKDDHLRTLRDTPMLFSVLIDHSNGADVDVDGSITQVQVVSASGPNHGTLSSGPTPGDFVYSPQVGFSGTDSFQYRVVDDDQGLSNLATVTIVVNAPPTARDDSVSTIEDLPVDIDVLADNGSGPDLDVDGALDPSSLTIVSAPIHGAMVPQDGGLLRYTPNLHFTGVDSFQYTVQDDDGAVSNIATVTIDVQEANLPPLGRNDFIVMNEDGIVTFDPLADNGAGIDRDLDGSLIPTTAINVDWPYWGGLSVDAYGRFVYRPPADFFGTVRFQYKVQDSDGALTKTYEAITEELYEGGQKSRLEHVWNFNVSEGEAQAVVVSGFHDSEIEDFGFEYSADGTNWIPLDIRLTNAGQLLEAELPPGLQGELLVRLTDSNRSAGDDVADSAYVEYLYIRSTRPDHPELPQLTVSDPVVTEAPDGTAIAQFTVTRTGDSTKSVTFAYETVDGTAEAGADYAPISLRTALLGPGVTQRVISVPILDDLLPENGETFFLQLSRPVGANISDDLGQATIQANDNPPHVTSVLVGSSSWTSDFRTRTLAASDGFYPIPTGANQLRVISWKIDQIRIVFDGDVQIDVDDLVVTSGTQGIVNVHTMQYADRIATWSIDPVSADRIMLNLSDRITADSSGLPLDGEFVTASGVDRSGDGSPGGVFHFRINILAGDINGDGFVASGDLPALGRSYLRMPGHPDFNIFADLNGDGWVASADLVPLGANYLRILRPTEPQDYDFPLASAAVAQSSLSSGEVDAIFLNLASSDMFRHLDNVNDLLTDELLGPFGLENRKKRDRPAAYVA